MGGGNVLGRLVESTKFRGKVHGSGLASCNEHIPTMLAADADLSQDDWLLASGFGCFDVVGVCFKEFNLFAYKDLIVGENLVVVWCVECDGWPISRVAAGIERTVRRIM